MRNGRKFRTAAYIAAALTFAIAAPAGAKTIVKIGSPTLHESVHFWMLNFKKRIEKRAGDRFQVQVYPASQLGSIPRMVEGAQLGTIEMIMVPPSFLVGLDQRFQVLSAPGVFKDQEQGFLTVQDPEFKKAFWHIGEKKGIKMLGNFCPADTNYASRDPIRHISDFAGKKIRVFASDMEREEMRRLGATAAPMPLTEVLPGLQRGVIDAAKSGMVIFVAFKYENTAKYVAATKESLICVPALASVKWFNKLSKADQKMFEEVAHNNDYAEQPKSIVFNNNTYAIWKKHGGEVTRFSPKEQKEFEAKIKTVADTVMKNKPEVRKMYELMKKVAARYAGK